MAEIAGTALLSVYDKAGIEEFAQGLSDLGWRIYASGGTAEAIKKAGVEVTDTSELSGGGAILGHRVVTLSREIYAGLLADDSDEQNEELKNLGIPRIDLVCVDMYPLKATIETSGSTEADVIEKTDVGGPTLLHAAAKGRRIVLSRPEHRKEVLDWLKNGRTGEKEFVKRLAAEAEYEVANYMIKSANYLGDGRTRGFIGERVAAPDYGENPWQKNAALYIERDNEDPLSLGKFKLIEGIELSYNNFTDVDRLLQTITHAGATFDKNNGKVPVIVLGAKHGNLCGAGYGDDAVEVVQKMLDGDLRAIFGGSVVINTKIDKKIAEAIMTYKMDTGKRILDIVMAPSVDDDALKLLKRKNGKLRVMINPALGTLSQDSLDKNCRPRYVRGGRLAQDNYTYVIDCSSPDVQINGEEPTQARMNDMQFAWAIGCTSNSNTICIVKDGMLLSNGVGQQDRVTAAELALMRAKNAGHDIKGASAYSDSFFPFPDGPQLLADAGVKAILTTRGSVKDGVVVDTLVKAGVTFCTFPDKQARGFYAH
jgi:phosphoribosylaminoimidazolecarboxamide formyltransferase/IMP cyclohydrolase